MHACSVMSNSVTPQTASLLCPWDFPGKNNWSGLPFPSPGDHPDPGMEAVSTASPVLQADSLRLSQWGSPTKELRP